MGQNIFVERVKDIRNGVGGYIIVGGYIVRVCQFKLFLVWINFRICVENFLVRVKWFEFKEFMSVVGDVIFVDMYRRRLGEGVVEFLNKEDMINVLELFDK